MARTITSANRRGSGATTRAVRQGQQHPCGDQEAAADAVEPAHVAGGTDQPLYLPADKPVSEKDTGLHRDEGHPHDRELRAI